MKENLKFQWENQAKRLLEDENYAKKFAETILEDVLQEEVHVEEVCVWFQGSKNGQGVVIVLDAAVKGTRQSEVYERNVEIYLYKNEKIQVHHKSFQFQYYCVETPAILLDSGSTRLNLTVREDILARWNAAVMKEQSE